MRTEKFGGKGERETSEYSQTRVFGSQPAPHFNLPHKLF